MFFWFTIYDLRLSKTANRKSQKRDILSDIPYITFGVIRSD